jgi:hypothetical protein
MGEKFDDGLIKGKTTGFGAMNQMANEAEAAKKARQAEGVEASKLEWGPEFEIEGNPFFTWNKIQEEIGRINSESVGGGSWRLPTVSELKEKFITGTKTPNDFKKDTYWSSELFSTGYAYTVDMRDGREQYEMRDQLRRIRLVRDAA